MSKSTKTVVARNVVLFSDFVRADSGDVAAQHTARRAAIYNALYSVFQAGNRTQLDIVAEACKRFADVKECKAALAVTTLTAPVKRMAATYAAYSAALLALPELAVMKIATDEQKLVKGKSVPVLRAATDEEIDAVAAPLADHFADSVSVALAPVVKVAPTEEEKATKKTEAEAKKAKAEADKAAAIQAEASKIAGAVALTLADMVRIVANAVSTGMVEPELLTLLDAAMDSVADVAFVALDVTEGEEAHA